MLNVCFDECAYGAMKCGLREESTHSYYALCYGPIHPESFDEIRKIRINQIYALCIEHILPPFSIQEIS